MYNCKPLAEEIKKKVNRFRYANDISMKITPNMGILNKSKMTRNQIISTYPI